MRILYLHQYFNTPSMSGGTRSFEMAKRWVAAGHEVMVITSNQAPDVHADRWTRTRTDGIDVYWLACRYDNAFGFLARLRAFTKFALLAGPKARKLNGDVVFATSTPLTIIVPAVIASIFRRTPIVFEVRDLWPEMPIAIGKLVNPILIAAARTLEHFAYRRAQRIIALSPGIADTIVSSGAAIDKIVIAPNACDVPDFEVPLAKAQAYRGKFPWLGDRPFVVYCGTIGELNNVGFLAAVAARAVEINPTIMFGVYGSGGDTERVRDEATRLKVLNQNFFLMGPVPKRDVPTVLAAANIATSLFLPIPEMEKNSANKFFDAIAAGRPVAINYRGWHAALVSDHGLGLVLDQHDPDTAAKQLCVLLENAELLNSAGIASSRLARTDFSRDIISDRVLRAIAGAHNESLEARRPWRR